MSFNSGLSMAEIKAVLSSEIEAAGGTMSDCFDDGARLFARSILPWVSEVRPQDSLQGGVALRAAESDVLVHPYVFRQVCRNGQIMTQTLESRQIVLSDTYSPAHAEEKIRETVRACADREVFAAQAGRIRALPGNAVDYMLFMLPFLSRFPQAMRAQLLADIGQRLAAGHDRSQYGVLNAVTSLARDTQDPNVRWQLEELGGWVICGQPRTPVRPRRAARVFAGG